jgi:hypothetical protein
VWQPGDVTLRSETSRVRSRPAFDLHPEDIQQDDEPDKVARGVKMGDMTDGCFRCHFVVGMVDLPLQMEEDIDRLETAKGGAHPLEERGTIRLRSHHSSVGR